MRKHEEFILTPITKILEEASYSTSNIESGLDSYPLSDYIMQSLFLKMTGFQEQKMKCILWEMATDDYELRYLRYKQKPLGECSALDEKNTIFTDLTDLLNKNESGSQIINDVDKQKIIDDTKSALRNFYSDSKMTGWSQKSYLEYEKILDNCDKSCILYKNSKGRYTDLLGHCDNCSRKNTAPEGSLCKIGSMNAIYTAMFKHRNRCAHNTTSFQQNLPSLETIASHDYIFENYFIRFFCLILIDKVFLILFKRYLSQNPEPFVIQ